MKNKNRYKKALLKLLDKSVKDASLDFSKRQLSFAENETNQNNCVGAYAIQLWKLQV